VLVVVQHAVAILVLVGAALLGKSLMRLVAVNPGFDATNVVTIDVSVPKSRYADATRRRLYYQAVIARLKSQPGVVGASAISNIFFGKSQTGGTFSIEGRPEFPTNARPQTSKMIVGADFFRTMRIPLL